MEDKVTPFGLTECLGMDACARISKGAIQVTRSYRRLYRYGEAATPNARVAG